MTLSANLFWAKRSYVFSSFNSKPRLGGGGGICLANFFQSFYCYPLLEKLGLCDTYENLLEIVIPKFGTIILLEYY